MLIIIIYGIAEESMKAFTLWTKTSIIIIYVFNAEVVSPSEPLICIKFYQHVVEGTA